MPNIIFALLILDWICSLNEMLFMILKPKFVEPEVGVVIRY